MSGGWTRYPAELRQHWRSLLAASVGLSFGYMVNMYVTSVFSPHLIAEFNWTRAQFALLGGAILIGMITMPVVGRLTDLFGVRRIATFGVVCMPLLYLAFSAAGPDFGYYFLISVLQIMLVGATTTSAVYSRIIAESFDRSRGLALSLAACSPALVAAVLAPLLSMFIDIYGWRAGYVALAAASAVGGAVALALIPRGTAKARVSRGKPQAASADYRTIFRSPVFRIITIAILGCNLAHTVIGAQLKLILLDQNVDSNAASAMISLFAIGVILGRLFCGFALDHFPTRVVAAVILGLPGIGLAVMGSHLASIEIIAIAILIIGLSTGAELDVAAYLVMRFFPLRIYSTAYGMVAAVIALSGALGSLLLSLTLHYTEDYQLYLLTTAITTIAGSSLFFLLPGGAQNAASSNTTEDVSLQFSTRSRF
jgi:MFS family permease